MSGIDCASISIDENDFSEMSDFVSTDFSSNNYQVNTLLEEEKEFLEAIPRTCLVIDVE